MRNLRGEFKGDVILMQETHCTSKEDWEKWRMESNMEGSGSVTSSSSAGVAILVQHDCFEDMEFTIEGIDGRSMYMTATRNNEKWLVTCIYAPNNAKERIQFFRNLKIRKLDLSRFDVVILGGDFNITLYAKDKIGGRIHGRDPSKASLQALIFEHVLCDAYNRRNPKTPCISWRNGQGTIGRRLDYLLTNQDLEDSRISLIKYVELPDMDHKACIMQIEPANSIKRGPSLWKLNPRLLNKKEWEKEIQELLRGFLSEEVITKFGDQWESCKDQIMQISQKWGKKLQTKYKRIRKWLELQLEDQEKLWISYNQNPLKYEKALKRIYRRRDQLRKSLENWISIHFDDVAIRNKIHHIEEGEKPTKYFFQLVKMVRANSAILELKDPDSPQVFKAPEELSSHIFSFYGKLYQKNETNRQAINQLLESSELKLSGQSKIMCDAPLTLEEVIQAIHHQKPNTSPGIDGITNEFYRKHAEQIAPILLAVYNDWLQKEILPISQRTGIICLIYKKGDRTDLQNFRPISLTCCDLKILTGIFANRLQKCIKEIIQPDQSGFIRGRSIHDNIRLVMDLLEYAKKNNITGGVLLLDQFKAFDLVNWDYMMICLTHYGFGPVFQKWMKILYKDLRSQVTFNGWCTPAFNVERGVRQGDPLSPLLFDLAIEGLANAIRKSDFIQGIPLPFRNVMKVSMYADDTLIAFSSQTDLDKIQEIIQLYCKASGAKINKKKSEVILFQSNDPPLFNLEDYTLKEFTKYLGVMIGNNIPSKLIWENIIKKMRAIIALWKRRNLSIQGRSLVAKSLILSKIWYIATNQVIPIEVLKEIKDIVYEYIWEGKKAPVRHLLASLEKEEGGIKVLNLETQIQALLSKWIGQLLSSEPKKWRCIVTWFIEEGTNKWHLGMNVFKTDKSPSWIKISPFWNEVMKVWNKLGISRIFPPQKRIDLLNEPIYRNPYIRLVGGQVIWNMTLLKNGIHTVKDLMIYGQLAREEDLGLFSDNGKVQEKIANTISILNEEWKGKIQSSSLDPNSENGILGLLANLILSDDPNPTLIPTPMNQQFGFIDNQQTTITLTEMTVKQAYKHLIGKQVTPDLLKNQTAWETELGTGQLSWEPIFNSCYDLFIINKKKELLWKILSKAIFTTTRLAKFSPEVSPLCLFCKRENESIRHLWYSCSNTKFLWSWVERLINHGKENNEKKIILNEFTIMTNGYDLEIKPEFKKIQWRALICEVKWQIWLARNEALWNSKTTITTLALLIITKKVFKDDLVNITNHRKMKGLAIDNEAEMVKEIIQALHQTNAEN